MIRTLSDQPNADSKIRRIKCVVWDLDDTLWRGILLESAEISPRQDLFELIQALDGRGILHSIASRNDSAKALEQLRNLGWHEFFLYPQIAWVPKSKSIRTIAERLNLGLDAFAFVDDQPFELSEVSFALPEVLCIPVDDVIQVASSSEFQPLYLTADGHKRRHLYALAAQREEAEREFEGTSLEFLASLKMVLTITYATEGDLHRAEELTVRTNQLNSTGRPYSYEELDSFRKQSRYRLLIVHLEDRFGPYGAIGLVLLDCTDQAWTIKLLLTSCRVIARGIGGLLIGYLLREAKKAGVRMLADFIATSRNRIMQVTYGLNGFRVLGQADPQSLLEHDLVRVPPVPSHVVIRSPDPRR